MKNQKYIIAGTIKQKEINGGNVFWILNGDIEINSKEEEIYIEDNIEGERSILVKNMPLEVQKYIKKNKKLITL